jgi:tetratricopeptide (TPR) repeat protein
MSRGYNNLGLNYYAFGKYDEAYFYYTQSYRLFNIIKDSLGMAVSLHNIATVFKELGQYANALNYLRLTQEISNDVHDYEGEAYNYDEIGDIYRRKKEYDSALNALAHSLKVSRSLRLRINDLIPETLIKTARLIWTKRIMLTRSPIMIPLKYSFKKRIMNLASLRSILAAPLFTCQRKNSSRQGF